jgi:hypothetical protein
LPEQALQPDFPDDIPAFPYGAYGEEREWKGISDFLGSKPSGKYVKMWRFTKARSFHVELQRGPANGPAIPE